MSQLDLKARHIWIYMLMLLPFGLVFVGRERLWFVAREDGVVEYLGAICFLAAAVLFGMASVRAHRHASLSKAHVLVLGLFALLCLFACGEEVSWGQRIFGIATPEWLQSANYQGELNLHNIGVPNGSEGSLLYFVTHFSWNGPFFGLLFIVIPWLDPRWSLARNLFSRFGIPIFPAYLAGVTLFIYVVLKIAELYLSGMVGYDPNWAREIWESLMGVLMIVAASGELAKASGPRQQDRLA